MIEAREVGIEQGIHIEGAQGWTAALLCMSDAGRELLRVSMDGEVTLPDDLTLDEAKAALIEMGCKFVTMAKGSR